MLGSSHAATATSIEIMVIIIIAVLYRFAFLASRFASSSSMANDSVATNFDQIFATYSPDTVRKVL